ncbi:TauD/TfdA family dioxygenase [Rugosimonospora acidiphila]|uniref:TauD/TfdA family dioxygenase n=1 Tax=Rugosimonospora acidiphila TaxID=556531 RepID=A0ABP9SGS3_9ACTN
MVVIRQVPGPAEWRADKIAGDDSWRYPLDGAHRSEVLAALAAVRAAGVPAGGVARGGFPLPTLGVELDRLAHDLAYGRGFALLRGVPLAGLTEPQCELVALGIAGHVGVLVGQTARRLPLTHVRDQGVDPAQPSGPGDRHRQKLGFHADPTDAVALLCVRPAKSGGLSSIVSSLAVHNELVRTRPDLAQVLYRPWWFDGRPGGGPESFCQQPVYSIDGGGGLVVRYGPDHLGPARHGAHALSAEQLEAMWTLDRLHDDPRFMLTMDLRAGDMQFLNNRVILHRNTAYQDHPEPQRRRDLIRLWLNLP